MDPEPKVLRPGDSDYPAALRRCSEKGRPPVVTTRGNLNVLTGPLLGFFCSVRAPGPAILQTYDLARALRSANVTLIGGFQSPMEREFLDILLRGTASVVVCPARGIGTIRISKSWRTPLTEGRLLILSFFPAAIRRPTAALTAKRNAHVAALANRLLIPHAEPGGKTAGLCTAALTRGQPVFTFDAPDTAHLVTRGAVPVPPNDLTPLLA